MRKHEPMTQTINVTAARRTWSQLLNQVSRGEKRVILERSGIPVAAIIKPADLERLRQLEAQREEDFNILDETQAAFADVPPEEVEREIVKALAAVRREQRRRKQPSAPTP